jgi:hypothetical protein
LYAVAPDEAFQARFNDPELLFTRSPNGAARGEDPGVALTVLLELPSPLTLAAVTE